MISLNDCMTIKETAKRYNVEHQKIVYRDFGLRGEFIDGS